MKLYKEAGMPDGVINFIPGPSGNISDQLLHSPDMAGVHFTGSTAVFQLLWGHIGANISTYKSYPRVVGETGGKDFVFAHPSADVEALTTALIHGAFEYAGQKCSAASRAFLPESRWKTIKESLLAKMSKVKMGNPEEPTTLVNAVISRSSFDKCSNYLEIARDTASCEIIAGGECDDSVGYFVQPTIVVTSDPEVALMKEEIFGPILTIYVYKDEKFEETLKLCDKGSPYGLTGAIFAQDRKAIVHMERVLENTAGNFYINDKPTGAVVGHQPFGGGRASGTNDKAGSELNLLRWVSARSIKENFVPPKDIGYPYMFAKDK